MAEWLGSALQKLLQRFESASDLRYHDKPLTVHAVKGLFVLASGDRYGLLMAWQMLILVTADCLLGVQARTLEPARGITLASDMKSRTLGRLLNFLLLTIIVVISKDYILDQTNFGRILPLRLFALVILLISINVKRLSFSLIALIVSFCCLCDTCLGYLKDHQGITHQLLFNSIFKIFNLNYGKISSLSFVLTVSFYLCTIIHIFFKISEKDE